jgi:hypothetical protein
VLVQYLNYEYNEPVPLNMRTETETPQPTVAAAGTGTGAGADMSGRGSSSNSTSSSSSSGRTNTCANGITGGSSGVGSGGVPVGVIHSGGTPAIGSCTSNGIIQPLSVEPQFPAAEGGHGAEGPGGHYIGGNRPALHNVLSSSYCTTNTSSILSILTLHTDLASIRIPLLLLLCTVYPRIWAARTILPTVYCVMSLIVHFHSYYFLYFRPFPLLSCCFVPTSLSVLS